MGELRGLEEVAASLGLENNEWDGWGPGKAKITLDAVTRERQRPTPAKLVLVSAITPTPAGEGKTTTAIGLSQGLAHIGENVMVALREPSLGPVFGAKGGATGGGLSSVHPADDIDLHFTGDIHAVTAAHNLLAAMVDNHLHSGLEPKIHPGRVLWRRVLDVCDRALRHVVSGLDGGNGPVRETGFDITAASEVMAVLCLADGAEDLKARLSRMVVAYGRNGQPVTAADVGAVGAMTALLRDALRPNLVQTTEGVPAVIHGGPFANIAHGCNSVMATRVGLARADWTITEAGFAFDLGGEKFFDIKCRSAGLDPTLVVLVATIRALRHHGGAHHETPDAEAVRKGLPNLQKHIENVAAFGKTPVVALNRFPTDAPDEIALVRECCEAAGVPFSEADPFGGGGPGCAALAELVRERAAAGSTPHRPMYSLDHSLQDKVRSVATTIYGASDVQFDGRALKNLRQLTKQGYADLPICMAKTQSSLSDDPKKRGRPTDFTVTVQEIRLAAGAGFLVVLLGAMVRMPGLPKRPSALDYDLVDGQIVGRS